MLSALPSLLHLLLPCCSSVGLLSPGSALSAVWEQSWKWHGELWRTWNRRCFDDVPEVFGVGHHVLFPSDYCPDKYVGDAWPGASDAPGVSPLGNCLHRYCLSSLSALCLESSLKLMASARPTTLKGFYFRPITATRTEHTKQKLLQSLLGARATWSECILNRSTLVCCYVRLMVKTMKLYVLVFF